VLIPMSEVRDIDRIKDYDVKLHAAARLYAENGIPVVPLRPGEKILPAKKVGINYFSGSTKLKTMERWFGDKGKYRGWNIGIVCGKEVFAVDLDLHGRENGLENFAKFQGANVLQCPVQQTPTGGRHLILKWRENLTSSSGKLAAGVDTRGGDGSPRSHVVCWPSRTDDGEYSWLEGGEVPDTPEWLSLPMGIPWRHKAGRGNEEVGEDDEENKYELSQITAMLDHINADELSYEQWLFVGQAINSQHPEEDGLAVWDAWSSTGERYVQGECQKRWAGFDPAGIIRMGSLIYFAKQGGYDTSSDSARTGDFAEIVERMNKDNAMILTGGKVRIIHRTEDGGIHIMGTQDFHTLMYNRKVTVLGKNKPTSEADIWMGHEDRRECIKGMGFFPNEELWHDGYVNLWQGWGVEPAEGNWEMFNNHILNVICDGNEELHTFVLDWCADLIQDPMEPKGTAIVLHGKEGTGKGTFCTMLGNIIGQKHYKHVTNEKHLTGNFNYHLMDGLLIFADEVVYGGDRRVAGLLKSLVTEKELICERKGIDSFMYENRARLCVASNEDWFIPAGPESRRWLVLDVSDKHANDQHYFKLMYKQMLEEGGCAAMMQDLMDRKITSNLSKAIETEALEAQRAIYRSTGDAVDIWLDECVGKRNLGVIDDQGQGDWPDDADRIGLFKAFNDWAKDKKIRTKGNAHFYRKLEGYGFVKHRPRNKESGIRHWRYKVPPYDKFDTEG